MSDPGEYVAMQRLWHPQWGDRRQELAVIGLDMDKDVARNELDACLLSNEELEDGANVLERTTRSIPYSGAAEYYVVR